MNKEKTKDWKKVKEEIEQRIQEEALNEQEDEPAPDESALEHLSYEELEAKLTEMEQKAHENWEKAVRASAELDNVRRRAERDVKNAHLYGLDRIINELLPVADSLEQALAMAQNNPQQGMVEGLELTMKLLLDTFAKHGVHPLDPLGQPFNPQEHEAMAMQEIPDQAANTVANVFQKGYKMGDRILRPARVIVAK